MLARMVRELAICCVVRSMSRDAMPMPWSRTASRATPPIRNDESVSFTALNRNKRSLVLDLKQPEAQQICRKLAACSDVLVEAYRPGALEKMGLGAEALKNVNPKLIYTSVSGFGQTGPDRRRAGVNAQRHVHEEHPRPSIVLD